MLLALPMGCADAEGQLSGAALERACAPQDPTCAEAGLDGPLAAGARIPIWISPQVSGSTAVALDWEVVNGEIADVEEGRIVGRSPGVTAILARTPGDGVVIDFLHIWVDTPERISLHRVVENMTDQRELGDHIQVFPGEDLILRLQIAAGPRRLLGDAQEDWVLLCNEDGLEPITDQPFSAQSTQESTSCDENFFLMDQGNPAERRLLVPEEGPDETTLVVRALGFEKTLRVEVVR
jgi:hypothetical protein